MDADGGSNSLEPSDSVLIDAALQGNVDAFQTLFERYWPMAMGVALSVCSDRHLAEDAAQEAFAQAARQLTTLHDRQRFPQWLRTICRRTGSRVRRRQQPFIALQTETPAPDSTQNESRTATLRTAMQQLDDDARELLVLRYFSEMSHDEIARTLKTTSASIHGRLQRARRKLTTILGREFSTGDAHVCE